MKGSVNVRHCCRRHSCRPFLTTVLVAVLAARCGASDSNDLSLANAREVGLRVGFAIEPPFVYADSTGEARGESPAVLRHVARALGIDSLQWFPLELDNLIPALEHGRIDVIAAGLFITDERAERVRFSHPTACLGPALVVPREAALSDRLFVCDSCTIAVIRGSVEHRTLQAAVAASESSPAGGATRTAADRVQTYRSADGATVHTLTVPDASTAIAALRSGDAAALAISAPTARLLVERDSTLALRETAPAALSTGAGCAAFAFRPADQLLANAFDEVLAAFVGSEAHLALVTEYGFTRREIMCAASARAEVASAEGC